MPEPMNPTIRASSVPLWLKYCTGLLDTGPGGSGSLKLCKQTDTSTLLCYQSRRPNTSLLVQLKAANQCASVCLEIQVLSFQAGCLVRVLGSLLQEAYCLIMSLRPAKTISLNCKHLKSSGCRTVASIIWLSGADRLTLPNSPSTRLPAE